MKEETQETQKIERLTVNAQEAAVMLGVSARTVFQLTKTGELPHKRIGNRVVYPIAALRHYIDVDDRRADAGRKESELTGS